MTKLFDINLEIRSSQLFVAATSLVLLGVKVKEDDDPAKFCRWMIEAGYIHWLRDASKDENVAQLMQSAREAMERAEREDGIQPDFESCVRVFATDLLNYYGGMFGIAQGIEESQRKANKIVLKSVSLVRNLDNLKEHVEASMEPDALAKSQDIQNRLRSGEITTEQALREAGAPEELVGFMSNLEKTLRGEADRTAEA